MRKTPDLGQRYTDKEVAKLDKEIRKVYRQSEKEINAKLRDFKAKHKVKDAKYRQMVKDGKMDKADYKAWKQGQVFQGKQWEQRKEQIASVLTHSDEVAHKLAQGRMQDVFTFNANFMSYKVENDKRINLGIPMYDSATVANLIKNNPKLLPEKKLNIPKDMRWNMKRINSQVTQSIIQGESIDALAERLSKEMPNSSYKMAKVHARTMMTSAQNAGRLESMKMHQKMGIKSIKVWIATLDERTRWMHRDLDGQEQEIDKPFEVGEYSIMYPADPNAEPAMIYNCRCSMAEDVKKYPSENHQRRDNINQEVIPYMTYNQWAEKKGIANERNNAIKASAAQGTNANEVAFGGYVVGKTFDIPVFKDDGNVEVYSVAVEREEKHPFPDGSGSGVKAERDADVFVMEDGTKFYFPHDMDTTKQTATPELMISQWYKVPEDYRQQIQKTIYVVDYRNVKDPYWAKRYKTKDFRSYATGGKNITFYAWEYEHDEKYLVHTYCHEGAHYIDIFSQKQRISETNEWKKAVNDDKIISGKDSPTSYGTKHIHEDFADSAAKYVTDRDMMLRDFPNRSKILKGIIDGNS